MKRLTFTLFLLMLVNSAWAQSVTTVYNGLNGPRGLTFGPDGRLYALELSAALGFPVPGAGQLVRVNGSNQIEPIITGLVVPTGLTTGPEGALYQGDFGAAPPGLGRILRVALAN